MAYSPEFMAALAATNDRLNAEPFSFEFPRKDTAVKSNAYLGYRPFDATERAELHRQGIDPDYEFARASKSGELGMVRETLRRNIGGRASLGMAPAPTSPPIDTMQVAYPDQSQPSSDVLGQIRDLLNLPDTATADDICAAIQTLATAQPAQMSRMMATTGQYPPRRRFAALSDTPTASEAASLRRQGIDPTRVRRRI